MYTSHIEVKKFVVIYKKVLLFVGQSTEKSLYILII